MKIIARPKLVQTAIRKTWSPSIIRHRFILQHERQMFNNLYNISGTSPHHKLDKIILGQNWDLAANWIRHRFTCLGKGWEVGTILIKERPIGEKTWWFTATSTCTASGLYDPNVVPYKHIIIPLQVNNGEQIEDFTKVNYYTTNFHYVKDNNCLFKHPEDFYQTTKSNYPLNHKLNKLEKADPTSAPSEWYRKHEFQKYTDEADKMYLECVEWDIELIFTWIPGSVLITDATRIYGYKTGIEGINQRRILSIMTYKVR